MDESDCTDEHPDPVDPGSPSTRGWQMTAPLPRDPTCSRIARRLLDEYTRDVLNDDERADARQIVSELANNSFVHGQGAIQLRVSLSGNRLRIELMDQGRRPDRIRIVPEQRRRLRGRGLWIVEQLAGDWGVDRAGQVWAELVLGSR